MKRLKWNKELVDKFWSTVSETRLAELNFSKLAGPQVLELVERHLTKDWDYLDFGAGDGDFVNLLIERGYKAGAWEPAQGRRDNLILRDFRKNPLFLGVIGPEINQKFDCIFLLDTIEHILHEDIDAVLTTIRNLLRRDGILIITTPNNEDLELNSVYCPKSGYFFHRWQHVRSFTAESLAELLNRFGFERLHDHRVDFSSYGELATRYKSLSEEVALRRRWGWLYVIGKYFHRTSEECGADQRIGAESNLIYIGRIQQA